MEKGNRKSILVVDDEEVIREFLSEVLGDDYEVSLAEDGDIAIKRITDQRFDLIITDLKMPRVSGDQVVKFAHDKHPDLPIIIVSGYSTLYAASQSVNYGACAFLSKPFSIAELTKTVDQSLEPHV